MSEAQQATNSLYHIAPTHPTQPADVSHLRLVPCPVHNLPVQLSSFIGRSHELVEVTDMLASARLLTLTGSGGCGKTRLALQAATDLLTTFSDGVWWIELAALADESLLPQTVARALGVHEQLGRPLVETIADHLQAKRQLLILDNCEHLVVACAALADTLLRTCPHLQVMATSREALRISGETVWRVPPLALPQHDPTRNTTSAYASSAQSGTIALLRSAVPSTTASDNWQLLAQAEAVQLFVARAAAILPAFRLTCQNAPVVAQICRRLDGIPLAIELAAARVNVLPVEQLAVRLDEDFRVLTAGSRTALPRHQTLRAAIEWSYTLLDEDERALFRRLAVFTGGWTLEAAEAVCASLGVGRPDVLDLLARLVDKSLVVMAEHAGEARYHLLEMVREYARECLQILSESDAMQRAHAAYFLRLLQNAEPHFTSAARRRWLARLEPDHDNVRAALQWATKTDDRGLCLRLVSACWQFWYYGEYWNEGRGWVEAALESIDRLPEPIALDLQPALGKALYALGWIAWCQGDATTARSRLEQSLALWRDMGCTNGLVHVLFYLSYVILGQGDPAAARILSEECLTLAREMGDRWQAAFALIGLGAVDQAQGAYASAAHCFEESMALFRELGETWGLAVALGDLGELVFRQGNLAQAELCFRESLELWRGLGDPWLTSRSIENMATIIHHRGDVVRAARLLGAAEVLRESIGAFVWPEHARAIAQVRSELGAPGTVAWAEGRTMGSDQAIAYALEVIDLKQATTGTGQATSGSDSVAFVVDRPSPESQVGMAPQLRIYALGTPRVERCGQALSAAEWGYAQPRELLFYLLAHRSRTKEQIGLAFWPDGAPAQLRSNFHRTLHHLRQALGRPEWIVRNQAGYAFNRALPYWYDVEAFESHLDAAQRFETTDPAQVLKHLEAAISLYRGDLLEHGVSGEWHLPYQQALRERYGAALLMLGRLLVADGRDAEASEAYRRAIVHDSFLEQAHRELMRCYARQGERGKALRHYQGLVELLDAELGAQPAPETTALCTRLRQGDALI